MSRLTEIDELLRSHRSFISWRSDPVEDDGGLTALKYCGYSKASDRIKGEYQIVSMLTGLFWEVEHTAMYKPAPQLRSVTRLEEMRQRYQEVLKER